MVARVIDHPFSAGVIPTPYNPDPVLLSIIEIIRTGLIRDQHVRLHQFGTFRLRWSKERRVKHPKTGESITVPPAPRITFTPAKQLREWIEPNRAPVVPLNEPLDKAATSTQASSQARDTELTKPLDATGENQPHGQPNLQETVEDIIDEQYSPPDNLLGIVNTQTDIQIDAQTETEIKEPVKPNKKWALGLLAAVPLIVYLLQADFTNESSSTEKALQPTPVSKLETKSAPAPTIENPVIKNNFVQAEDIVPANKQSGINNKIIRTEGIAPDSQQSSTPNKSAAQITARSEPTPKPFYMSPQVHTIQQGENLWSLAKQFYGDALLWPHIYRANTRTLSDPDKIISGKNLVIPGLQESPEMLTRKDKELIAEGYFMVYEFKNANNSDQAIHFLIGAKQYSFEWLRQNKSQINKKDWKSINR